MKECIRTPSVICTDGSTLLKYEAYFSFETMPLALAMLAMLTCQLFQGNLKLRVGRRQEGAFHTGERMGLWVRRQQSSDLAVILDPTLTSWAAGTQQPLGKVDPLGLL